MNKHQGQIIEYVVRKNGYNISDLAKELGVNRRSIYNYFGNRIVKNIIIIQIGKVIRHDFSLEFPDIFHSDEFKPSLKPQKLVSKNEIETEDDLYKDKYIALLEKYNNLLLEKYDVLD